MAGKSRQDFLFQTGRGEETGRGGGGGGGGGGVGVRGGVWGGCGWVGGVGGGGECGGGGGGRGGGGNPEGYLVRVFASREPEGREPVSAVRGCWLAALEPKKEKRYNR